ncbi:hypothetical protein [Candidatus Thiosymbion oneisti]|uniref:hypothetical protein n=1 Tax=Candidatus Thiosymbion oneisti TaxID=589554 RepID=UPI00210AD878|nr:hypothetical protein [Candidatus Thiosymbion oneisti]
MYLPVIPARQPRQSCRRTGTAPAIFAGLLLAAGLPLLSAQPLLDAETEELLVAVVEVATELDLYNTRCRRDRSGRRVDNLNKELVSKFRMTVLQIEDELFPERSYRRAQERLQRESLARLKQIGGCEEAKKAGMPNRLRVRYDDLMGKLERLP